MAIADPNVNAIDELKLATRLSIELGVSSKEDIVHEVKRLARAAEAFGARAMLEAEEEELAAEEDDAAGDDLEAEDGISDAPLVRLVNSIIFQAAEEGAWTFTSSRSPIRSSSGSARTASCTRCSGCRSG